MHSHARFALEVMEANRMEAKAANQRELHRQHLQEDLIQSRQELLMHRRHEEREGRLNVIHIVVHTFSTIHHPLAPFFPTIILFQHNVFAGTTTMCVTLCIYHNTQTGGRTRQRTPQSRYVGHVEFAH